MLRWIFFKFIDVITYLKPVCTDFSIRKTYEYIDGTSQIHYRYMNKPYVFIGKTEEFPPVHRASFSVPIKTAHVNGLDMTRWVKMCAGPKNVVPDPKYIHFTNRWVLEYDPWFTFRFKRVLVPQDDTVVHTEDILNRKHVLGKMLCHLD